MESTLCSTLTMVRGELVARARAGVWTTDSTELSGLLDLLHEIGNARDAIELNVIRQADALDIARTVDATSTAAWVAGRLRIDPRQATKKVHLAARLDRQLPAAKEALAAGEISLEQAQLISQVTDRLPKEAPIGDVDKTLTDYARTFGPIPLRKLGHHVLEVVDPELADRVLRARLAQEEREEARDAWFRLTPDRETGMWRVAGLVDRVTGERLHLMVQARSRPNPGADGPDLSTAAQRQARAFHDVVETAHNSPLVPKHGGNRTQLVVMLKPGTDVGTTLHTGQNLSPELVQQLMCECDVSYLLPSEPGHVHVTDPERLFTGKVRRQLDLRDAGCAFPGCDRPPGWCHAHHIIPWSKGGKTTLGNGVLLCSHHHRVVHHGDWLIRMARDGLPEFVPPPWIDPHQAPLRNPIHHL